MTKKPFDIKEILFDIVLCAATLILGALIFAAISYAIYFIFKTNDIEKTLGYSFPFAIPVGATVFYIIRRRFNYKLTLIQILLTSILTFALTYCWTLVLDYLPDYYTYETGYLILFVAVIVFVLTKHLSDRIIIKIFLSADT